MSEVEVGDEDLVRLSGEIAAAYVSHNAVSPADLPKLLKSAHAALAALRGSADPVPSTLVPAVQVRKSIRPDAIVCLECGQSYKSIRRHLRTSHGLSPEEYRRRWNLPSDYPVAAPDYSAKRSEMAKSFGLGGATGAKKRVR